MIGLLGKMYLASVGQYPGDRGRASCVAAGVGFALGRGIRDPAAAHTKGPHPDVPPTLDNQSDFYYSIWELAHSG